MDKKNIEIEIIKIIKKELKLSPIELRNQLEQKGFYTGDIRDAIARLIDCGKLIVDCNLDINYKQ